MYINESLCKTYKDLWFKAKQPWNTERINKFFTSNGTLKVKKTALGSAISITHIDDLRDLFPDEIIDILK